jgi:crotonobetainyl-CoA:carnitine CoA-transferase CaiB-like acyl-CoA transferase
VVVPCEAFPTQDGHIFIMCILPKFWSALCEVLDLNELPADPRFATPAARLANRDALVALLDARLATAPTATWVARLAGKVPVAPVLNLGQALDSPHVGATGGIQTVDHPARPGLRVLSSPIRLDGERPRARPAPALGSDTQALLAEAGYAAGEITALRAEGVI